MFPNTNIWMLNKTFGIQVPPKIYNQFLNKKFQFNIEFTFFLNQGWLPWPELRQWDGILCKLAQLMSFAQKHSLQNQQNNTTTRNNKMFKNARNICCQMFSHSWLKVLGNMNCTCWIPSKHYWKVLSRIKILAPTINYTSMFSNFFQVILIS